MVKEILFVSKIEENEERNRRGIHDEMTRPFTREVGCMQSRDCLRSLFVSAKFFLYFYDGLQCHHPIAKSTRSNLLLLRRVEIAIGFDMEWRFATGIVFVFYFFLSNTSMTYL